MKVSHSDEAVVVIKKQKGYVYSATSPINKLYIGQSTQKFSKRKRQHLYAAKRNPKYPFHHAINKYGFDNIEWKILYESDDLEDLNHVEKFYIKEFETLVGQNGYNLASGGLNYEVHESTKKKMSLLKRGEKHPLSRLTRSKVEDIREKYLSGEYTYVLLSKEYGVSRETIVDVVRNRSWKDDEWYEENKNFIDEISKNNKSLGGSISGIKIRKLDEKSAKEIREIYHNSKITQKKLAEKYEVSTLVINHIMHNKTYFDPNYQKFLEQKQNK